MSGAGVCNGYNFRPQLTAERFLPDPFGDLNGERLYRSGDLARCLECGELEYIGRRDHQVKIRGFRIELGAIESELESLPGIYQAAVIVSSTDTSGALTQDDHLVAYLVADQPIDAELIRNSLSPKLPDYMLPAAVVILSKMPLTVNGKIDRAALPLLNPVKLKSIENIPRGVSNLETVLIKIWMETLRHGKIDLQSNFFEQGGHSLLALKITNRINQLLKLDLSPVHVLEYPILADYAAFLSGQVTEADRIDKIAAYIIETAEPISRDCSDPNNPG